MDTLNKQYGPLSAQSMALNREIDAAKADDAKAQQEFNNAKNDGAKKAANKKIEAAATKAKNAEEKLTPIKTKMDGIDKKIKELREKLDPLEKPAKCPKCPADAGNSSFEPLPGDEFAGGPITGGGNFCPPPQETYIPGTPGHFSEQYASEIPGSGTPGEFVTYKVPFTSDSTAYCTFGEGTSVPGTTIATDDNGSWIPPSSDSGSGQTDIPAGPGTKIGAARQLHSIRLGLRDRWQCRRRPELEQLRHLSDLRRQRARRRRIRGSTLLHAIGLVHRPGIGSHGAERQWHQSGRRVLQDKMDGFRGRPDRLQFQQAGIDADQCLSWRRRLAGRI